ncbi:MAG: trypsin-like peptidase domain-containing protein [Candidatus Dormibacteraeota bacterium]|nr:trypsin-like peptidase domain-containing protein [Candidatus Dormibacteraeota bacterium]
MIEPSGPESPRGWPATQVRITVLALVAVVLVAALAGGAVAAGVTLGILHQQARTNQQSVDLGSRVTVSEDSATSSVAGKAAPAVVTVVSGDTNQVRGSGFLVTSDGYIVTNLSVVANAKGLTVLIPSDSHRHDARLVDYDCQTGTAVLKVDGVSNLPTLGFGDPTSLKVGQDAIAVGGVDGASRGVVSAVHQAVTLPDPLTAGAPTQMPDVIYTDAALSSSDVGGPLLNIGGQVVGVLMGSGQTPNMALGIDGLQAGVEEIIQTGQLMVPSLGAQTTTVTSRDVALSGGTVGARIQSDEAGGPAQRAGLKAGDVITQLDDQKLDDQHALPQVLRNSFRAGQKVTVSYVPIGASATQVQLVLTDERPTCQ